MNRKQVTDKLVDLLFLLSTELQSIEGANRENLWPLLPDQQVTEDYEKAREIMDEVFAIVKDQNGEMLSDDTILTHLLFNVSAIRLDIQVSDNELEETARREIRSLLDYEGQRDVDVPLVSLEVGEQPIQFGPVQFRPISEEDRDSDWWLRVKSSLGDMTNTIFLSYARVNVPGDAHRAIYYARDLAHEGLQILRGIGFPITSEDVNQIGILNEYPLWQNVPYRLTTLTETTRVDSQSPQVTTTGPFRTPYHLVRDILSAIDKDRLRLLIALLAEHGFQPQEEMPAKLISGLRWLGDATKPDSLGARFAKLTFSLESLIGGEATEELLTTRGLTATLAERAAFLVSGDYDRRIEVDRDIRRYYKKRSDIVHGREAEVAPEDLEGFGTLVKEIAWSLLDRIDQFRSVNDLQYWVKVRKYAKDDEPHSR